MVERLEGKVNDIFFRVLICNSNQNNVRWVTTFFIFSLDMALLLKRSVGSQKRLIKR